MLTRRLVIALAVIILLVAAPARAQFNDPQLASYIDSPQDGWTGYQGILEVRGWALHCTFGQQPQSLAAYYWDGVSTWVSLPIFYRTGIPEQTWRQYRPDVRAAFVPYCPEVTNYLGFSFQFAQSIPPGWRTLMFIWRDRTGTRTDYRTVNVLP